MNTTILETPEFINRLKGSDFKSWLIVQNAYHDDAFDEEIMEIGFNLNTGYVYIALENGIQIASCFGQSVDFIVTDFYSGEEHFLDTYKEAYKLLNTL
jgi:hypothetical protein